MKKSLHMVRSYWSHYLTQTIFITGGIVSGLGKGITSASLGTLLKARGFSIMPLKMDPYLNVDAGTMNPFQHGEVFVTDDGAETDLDLGHYERFLDINVSRSSNFTMGAVYQSVTEEERKGTYLGKTIQIVPHVTNEIQRRFDIQAKQEKPDFQIIEIGGTVGDLEAGFSLEAVRQYLGTHRKSALSIHVVKMDYIYPSDEAKTKPIQQSVALLRSYGISPDILIVRAKRPLTSDIKEKIALFCGVEQKQIIAAIDAESLYDIPLNMEKEGLAKVVLQLLKRKQVKPDLSTLKEIATRTKRNKSDLSVGLVGKYTDLSDSYLSVIEAIKHAGIANHVGVTVVPIDSERLRITELQELNAMIVPGGFGSRGIEGKIRAIQWAREHNLPFLGICLGLQCAVIEIARHVGGVPTATSEEFHPDSEHHVIAYLPEQASITRKGGTMRLGSCEAILDPESRISRLYMWASANSLDFPTLQDIDNLIPVKRVSERHRHRYELNPKYHQLLKDSGMIFSGSSLDGKLVEFCELPTSMHCYFVATQAHPEFKSRPNRSHPLFAGLIAAAKEQLATDPGEEQPLSLRVLSHRSKSVVK